MKKTAPILATTALLAAGLAAPAHAADYQMKTCWKSQYGETVKVRIRFDRDQATTRVRVSHPNGSGVFQNAHVKKVYATLTYGSGPEAVTEPAVRYPASRIYYPSGGGLFTVAASFQMTSGKTIRLTCALHEH